MGNRRSRRGEVQHCLRTCEELQWIIFDSDAARGRTHHLAQILADPVVAWSFGHARQIAIIAFVDCLNQHLTHTARTPNDCNGNLIRHDVAPRFL